MIASIKNNPYRILGVFSNSTKREIVQNTSKLSRYIAVGKQTRFACDLTSLLGSVDRTENSINQAKASLESNEDRIKHAFFWLVSNPKSLDESYALDLICNGDPQRAGIVLRESITYSSLVNRAVASFLSDDIATAIQSIDWLISVDQFREQFVHSVCGELYDLSITETYDLFIGALCDNVNPIVVYENIYEKEPLKHFLTIFCDRLVHVYSKRATSQLAKYSSISFSSAFEEIDAAEKIYHDVYLPIEGMKALVEGNDELRLISDKVVTRLLDLTIDAHNKSHKLKEEGSGEEYRVIGPRCSKVLNGIVKQDLSTPVMERLAKNQSILSDNVKNLSSTQSSAPSSKSTAKPKTEPTPIKSVVVKKPLKERIKGFFSKNKN